MTHADSLFVAEIASGEGTPVVCLHGFLGRSDEWMFLADRLPGRSILALDLLGHGASIGLPQSAYSVDGAAALVASSIEQLGLEGCHLIGYSMGGRVALEVACSAPKRIVSLFLESANPGIDDAEERRRRRIVDEERAASLRSGSLDAFLDAWYRQPVFASMDDGLRADCVRRAMRNDRLELARAVEGMSPGRQRSRWDSIAALQMPLTYVSGALDTSYVANGRRIADVSADAVHRIVSETGHAVHRERPDEFGAIVREHLERAEGGLSRRNSTNPT